MRSISLPYFYPELPPMATVGMSPSEDGPPSSSGAEASYAHPPALRQCDPPTFSGIELEDVDD